MRLESKWVVLLIVLLWRQCSGSSTLDLLRRIKGDRVERLVGDFHVDANCSFSLIGQSSSQVLDPVIHARVECDSGFLYDKSHHASEIAKMKEGVKIKDGLELFHRTTEGFVYVHMEGHGRFQIDRSTFRNLPPIPGVDTLAPVMAQGGWGIITNTVFEGNKGFKVAGAVCGTPATSSVHVLQTMPTSLKIIDCTMSDNGGGDAGAISIDSGDLDAKMVKMLRNEGEISGAVRLHGEASLGLFRDCTFEGVGAPPEVLRYVKSEQDDFPTGLVPQVGAVSAEDRSVCIIRTSNFTNHGSFLGTIMTNGHTTLVVEECNFESNVAASGGAVHVNGDTGNDAKIWWSTLKGNRARHGGAMTILGKGVLNVYDSHFQENHAHNGGAFFGDFSGLESTDGIDCERASQGTRIELESSKFMNNSAHSSGGAVFGRCTQIWIDTNVFADNHAGARGGGIFLDHGFTLDTPNCVYHGNRGNIGGGAIFANNSALLELEQCSLVGNHAGSEGGGAVHVVGVGTVNLIETNVTENEAIGSGGALFLQRSNELKVEKSLIRGNQAGANGGGAAFESIQKAHLLQSDFHENSAKVSGGAVASSGAGALSVEDCSLVLNDASMGDGGAIFASQVTNFSLSKTDVDSVRGFKHGLRSTNGTKEPLVLNNSAGGIGGAVFISDSTRAVIDKMDLVNNTAEEGGAFGSNGLKNLHIIDSHLEVNDAKIGGGLSLSGSEFVGVQGSVLQNNSAENFGGAASLKDVSEIHMSDGSIAENTAQLGAGLHMSGETALTASGILFNRNEATEAGGAVSCGDETEIRMDQSTFTYNFAPNAGSISAKCSCNVTARHCSFHRDKKRKDNGDFFESAQKCSRIESEHCKFRGGNMKISLTWILVIICATAVVVSLAAGVGRAFVIARKKKEKARAKKQEAAGLLSEDESDPDEYEYYSSSDDYTPDSRAGKPSHGGKEGPSAVPGPYVLIVERKSTGPEAVCLRDASVCPVRIESEQVLTYEAGASDDVTTDDPVKALPGQPISPDGLPKNAPPGFFLHSSPVVDITEESVRPRGLVNPGEVATQENEENEEFDSLEVVVHPEELVSTEIVPSSEAVASPEGLKSSEEATSPVAVANTDESGSMEATSSPKELASQGDLEKTEGSQGPEEVNTAESDNVDEAAIPAVLLSNDEVCSPEKVVNTEGLPSNEEAVSPDDTGVKNLEVYSGDEAAYPATLKSTDEEMSPENVMSPEDSERNEEQVSPEDVEVKSSEVTGVDEAANPAALVSTEKVYNPESIVNTEDIPSKEESRSSEDVEVKTLEGTSADETAIPAAVNSPEHGLDREDLSSDK